MNKIKKPGKNWDEVKAIVDQYLPDYVIEMELARLAKVSTRAVRKWKARQKGPRGVLFPRVWLFRKDDVSRFLKERAAK